MKKFLVVTSITNSKDKLIDPPQKYDNCDYYAFVDKKETVKIWEQFDIFNFSSIDNFKHRRNAKPYILLSTIMFPNYEYIIWMDGNHQLKVDPENILNEYGDSSLYVFKHPDRNCVYDELDSCIKWRMDSQKILTEQLNYYKEIRFPQKFGLFEMPTFIVKNTHKVKELQLTWFEQINRFSSRDQISFPFSVWKHKMIDEINILKGYANIFSMEGKNNGNEYFIDQGRHLKY